MGFQNCGKTNPVHIYVYVYIDTYIYKVENHGAHHPALNPVWCSDSQRLHDVLSQLVKLQDRDALLNVGDHILNHHMMLRTARGNDASELAAGIEVANIALLLVVLDFAFPIPDRIEPPVRRFNLLLAFRHRPRIVRIFFLGNTLLRHCWFRIFRLRLGFGLGFGLGWGFGLRSTLLRHSHRRHESHG